MRAAISHDLPANDAEPLDAEQARTLRATLGLEFKRTPYKNRIAFNVKNEGIVIAAELEGRGLLIQDRPEHYGSMRVYRLTRSGFAALGLKPKAALLVAAERAAEASIALDSLPLPFPPMPGAPDSSAA